MSEIREMIQELCPDGVEFKKLGEIAEIKPGKDYKHLDKGDIPVYGSGGIMTYVNDCVYNKPTVLLPRKGSISNVFYVDNPFWNVDTIYYTIIDTEVILPRFFYHVILNEHIEKLNTSNAARPALTKAVLDKIEIPVPPMAVQRKIVEILDNFSNLTAELEAELEERKRQYEYYRNLLLTFNPVANGAVTGGEHQIMDATENRGGQSDATWLRMSDIGAFYGGLSGKSKKDFGNGNAKYITYMNVYSNISVNMDLVDTVSVSTDEKQNAIQFGDILFTGSSETPDECGMSSVVTEFIEEPTYLNSFCFGFRPYNIKSFNVHFLKHLFRSQTLRKQIVRTASGVTRFNVSKKKMLNVSVPIPSIEKQNYIADILDRFETLTTDLQSGIPAEIAARRQQYEYYREKLLTFKRKAA